MFKFLSLFRRNTDEQQNDNDYDFNELPVPADVQEMPENRTPVLMDNDLGGQDHPVKPTSVIDITLLDQANQARIIDIQNELRKMGNDPGPRSGEDRTNPDHQEEDSIFDVNGKTLLGKGGENFVYAIPDDESVVGRVEIEPLIDQLAQAEGQPNTNDATTREKLQAMLAAENATYDELCRYFGNEHVPQTTRSVRPVTTSREFLEAIHKAKRRDMPNVALGPTDMVTIVAIQEKVPEINDDKSLEVKGGLAEARNPKVMNTESYRNAYDDATQALVCDPESPSFDLDQFLVIHPDLRPIVEQSNTNPQLRDALKDFVQKAMQFSKETGKGLDLNGAKNILFFQNADGNSDSSWNYKLVDATSPYAEVALVKTKDLMKKVIAKEPIEDHIERHLLRSAVNYQRALNGLARQLGVEDHLDVIPSASTITPSEFWEVLYDGGPPESSSQEQVAA